MLILSGLRSWTSGLRKISNGVEPHSLQLDRRRPVATSCNEWDLPEQNQSVVSGRRLTQCNSRCSKRDQPRRFVGEARRAMDRFG